MRRLDFYVQHLLRHGANGIELTSGQPVVFDFPTGKQRSKKVIDRGQVTQLVREAAPAEAMQAIDGGGEGSFQYASEAGMNVRVLVRAHGDSWSVRIEPAAAKPEPELDEPLPGAEAPRIATTTMGADEVEAGRMRASLAPPTGARSASAQMRLSDNEPKIHRYLRAMVEGGASDLHLSAGVAPMARIHGDMQLLEQRDPMSDEELRELVVEIMPERNRTELEDVWDTDFSHSIEGLARFRVNVFYDRKGIGAVFRQIPFEILSVDQIGLPPKVLDLCWLSKGLVLVTGPTGSGKSTTLATLLDYINQNRADHIITIEDPVEFVHDNKKCLVNQREVGTHTKTFKNALRAALREDPDIVLVGEMRDLETIHIAIETAETGHLVFGTLHTTSAISTVDRLIDQFPADQQAQIRVMLSESLRGVIAQVLCRKKEGGRIAGYEVLMSTPAVSNLVREGKTFQLASVMQTGGNQGMQTMNDHLMAHVREGRVTPEEAYIKSNDKAQLKQKLASEGITLSL